MRGSTHASFHPVMIAALLLSVSSGFAQDISRIERRGESLLSKHCSMCHAIGRLGRSSHREAPPFRTLSKRYPIESLSEALGEGLLTGHPDMPEFVFSPRDVGAILAYLHSIQEP
jgi:mono/diheme cytochrome c family protein